MHDSTLAFFVSVPSVNRGEQSFLAVTQEFTEVRK